MKLCVGGGFLVQYRPRGSTLADRCGLPGGQNVKNKSLTVKDLSAVTD